MPGFDQAVPSSATSSHPPFAQSEEQSVTYGCSQPLQEPLSTQLWGAPLTATLPKTLSRDGIVAVPGDAARVAEYLAREFPSLREDQAVVPRSPELLDAKREFLGQMCDRIELRHMDQTIGVIVGAPLDWSTYYVRVYVVTPAYQRPTLTRRLARDCLFDPLIALRVQRIEAETSPSNIAMTRALSEMQFYCTGHLLSERWGALVRYTKFLDPACENAFHKRFAGTAPPCSIGARKEDIP